jgi:hypothetical protein
MVQAMRTKAKGVIHETAFKESFALRGDRYEPDHIPRCSLNPRKFAQGFSSLIALTLSLSPLTSGIHSVRAADITTLSVLAMAKAEAEKETYEASRIELRARVARFMKRAGQENTFGSYAAESLAAYERFSAPQPNDEVDEHNLRIEREASRALLAGDENTARHFLAECKLKLPPPSCSSGEFPVSEEAFLNLKFLRWEVDAGNSAAALKRLKGAAWPPDVWQIALLTLGPDVAAGEPEKMQEVGRLIRQSGITITSCVAEASSLFLYSDLKVKPLSAKAKLRRLACDGQAQTAVEQAQAEENVSARVTALGIVAEGLAAIPGFADE